MVMYNAIILIPPLYFVLLSVIRREDTSHTVVQTGDLLVRLLDLRSGAVAQQLCLLDDFRFVHIPYTDDLLPTVDYHIN
jgi:hypothetical protein